ncbi:hypothetical protein NIES2100_27200 [Calothrix sp. NIES-2100]|nr:hypothetical protein NIES2100_27200 [Calothrix sp. NIES-2100]
MFVFAGKTHPKDYQGKELNEVGRRSYSFVMGIETPPQNLQRDCCWGLKPTEFVNTTWM